MKRAGLTMTTMALYVALFFAFSTFAIAMSTNFNYKTLSEKGNMWINEQFDKLQYNFIKSAKNSTDVSQIGEKIVFSNNDEYTFDLDKKRVLKNGGVIAMDVEVFEIIDIATLTSKADFVDNLDGELESIALRIKLSKYGCEKTSELFITTGDGYDEEI